jgi:hypothetical protein
MALITLEQAKAELRIVTDDEDEDIQRRADQATAIVIDYLKDRANPLWDLDTVPGPVQAAIFVMLTNLYERDPAKDAAAWDAVERLVIRFRDPALA